MNGDSIRTTGSATATAAMKQVAEAGMGGAVTMSQNNQGVWSMSEPSTDDLEGMTDQQTQMYNAMNDAVSGSGVASFHLIDENDALSHSIFVGDNGAAPAGNTATPGVHTIDMGDVKNFGTTGALTSQGALIHEVSEGVQIQTKGVGGTAAHFDTAIPTEAGVNGIQINLTRQSAPTMTVSGNTTTVSVPITTGGVQKTVTITFTNGNILPGGVQNNGR